MTLICITLRHGVRDWHCTARNEVKSFSPSKALRSPMHPFSVQRFVKMGYPITQHCRTQAMIVDDVAITASRGAKSGMKIIRYSFNPTHRDVTGKFAFTPNVHAASLRCAVSKCTTCPVPCTPASVRPAQKTVMGSFATCESAFSASPAHCALHSAVASRNTYCRRTQCPAQFYKLAVVAGRTLVQVLLHQFLGDFTAISAPPKRTLSATDQNWTCSGIP